MYNEKSKTKLTLENYGNTMSWESPYNDVSMDNLLYAFYGLCVAATWNPRTVLEGMRDFVDERLYLLEGEEESSMIIGNANDKLTTFINSKQETNTNKNEIN